MTITINTKAYNQNKVSADSIVYAGPNDTVSTTDELGLKRVDPKPSGNFAGVARSSAKISRSSVLANGQTVVRLGEANFSMPVGVTQAEAEAMADDLGTFLKSTEGKALVWKQTIGF